MSRYVRENSLTLVFLAFFAVSLIGQAFVGHADFNHDQVAHQGETLSLWRYLLSSAFWVDVMENWQSEYLQFTLFILGTVWLVQRGSTESKPVGKAGGESDEDQKLGEHAEPDSPKWAKAGGFRTLVYSNSLLLLMGAIWLASWFGQLITGRVEYNAEQLDHQEAGLTLVQYAGSSDFWNRTLQNWQSEFLAVASMVVFSIWLRQRGSSQSKPVGEAHAATGAEG
ncbi:MAG: hypothetical protein AVDCRST_MAG85-995 [uncultured Solirubrobacteraceae bacterium]|uniref:Transmembrane protein n=1 Tax=uncultured Solirubrobacteraceae bacterium TaxID=1162706 RepID=A0A6J4S0N1_9ACTN|nr:MAG: hypothetical protein AVDCRST_MAG85-995 [uncultured Solirubrobacteraceae bacterium]